ncbi:MAG: TetR/AcrR family transcriptional regulator [Chloroflexota bacterium]|nr:MAG: TetR/AcrR family transcriptional regulator [Chloroflexota bacterium]
MDQETRTQGAQTKVEITQVAHRLFLEQGYHGTSMRQIAQKTGIALGGIYNHFDSKDQIFSEVILTHHPYYEVVPALQAAQGETVEEFVRDAAERLVSNLGARMDFLKLMFIELVEFNGEHIPQIFKAVYPDIMDFARRFSANHSELRDIPAPVLVRAFIGLFFSYLLTEITIGQFLPTEQPDKSLDYFIDIYLYGVMVDSSI